jgi:hypothetical protein
MRKEREMNARLIGMVALGLLAVAALAPGDAAAATARVSVAAAETSLTAALADVARQAGLTVHGVPAGETAVAVELTDVPVEAALARLLRGGSYVLGYAGDRVSDVWVLSAPVGLTAARPARATRPDLASRLARLSPEMAAAPAVLVGHALRDPEPSIRAEALARLPMDGLGLDTVRAALADPDPGVRALANRLLGRD